MKSNTTTNDFFTAHDSLIEQELNLILCDPQAADELAQNVATQITNYITGTKSVKQDVVAAAFCNDEFRRGMLAMLDNA